MDKLITPHHSLTDWSWNENAAAAIYDQRYVSAPTCLAAHKVHADVWHAHFMLDLASGLCIPDGRIVTWLYDWNAASADFFWYFRCQGDPVGEDPPDNCYWLLHGNESYILYKRVAAANTLLQTAGFDAYPEKQWVHLRLTWYVCVSALLERFLRIVFEREVGIQWVEIFSFDHGDNLWNDSETNKVGFRLWRLGNDYYDSIDDTEIWRKTA